MYSSVCRQWISSQAHCCFASTGTAAIAPGQGSQRYVKKTSSHEGKVYREDLDGETDPREGSKLEFKKKKLLTSWLAKTEAPSSLEDFQSPKQGAQDRIDSSF